MSDDVPLIDTAAIELLRSLEQNGTPGLLTEVIGLFLNEAPGRLATLRAALTSGDAASAQSEAHALRGSAGALGARRLQLVCTRIEEAGRQGRTDATGLEALVSALDDTCAALRAERNTP